MAIARETTARNIRPLEGAIMRRYTLGATAEAGEIVSMAADGKVDPASAAMGSVIAKAKGIALQAGVDGDIVDIVVYGPVRVLTGATPGATVYVSDTAGEPAEVAGTISSIVGVADSAQILFVNPR